jgi:hypothetical protein
MVLPILLTSCALFAIGGLAAWYVHSMQTSTSDLLTKHVAAIRAALERFSTSLCARITSANSVGKRAVAEFILRTKAFSFSLFESD